MNEKILNIIWTICFIIITIAIVCLIYYMIKPEKVYIQKWTSPESGITYYISNAHIQKID